jgi:DUF1680 family protein
VQFAPDSRLGRWVTTTHEATVPHIVAQVEVCGAVENLRQVRDGGMSPYQGMWFADSDVYKALEAVAWDAGRTGGTEFIPFLEATAELLRAVQDDDGYVNSWFQRVHPEQRWKDLGRGHEMYCAGHLIQASIAAARALGRDDLLGTAGRFADLLVKRFGPEGEEGLCGHPEIETALVELYRETGTEAYLGLAQAMVERRGRGLLGPDEFGSRYFQDHAPVREATEATGHAVRQLYLACGVTDVYLETADASLLEAMEGLWDSAYGSKTYITGGQGSRHRDEAFGDPFELPPDRAYAETCAAIAAFHWNWRLLLATGRSRYADAMEWTLHNAIAASTTEAGTAFFYSNPLHLRAGHDGSEEDAPSSRLPWYRIPCCPPNIARLLGTIQNYIATTDPDGIQVQLYAAGSYRVPLQDGRPVVFRIESGYPWSGAVRLVIEESPGPEDWTLSLRLPGWADSGEVAVNGVPAEPQRDGYVALRRSWVPGDVVTLDLPMVPRFLRANPQVDAVRGAVSVVRGPLVYAMEQAGQRFDDEIERVRVDTSVPPREERPVGLADVPVALAVRGIVEPIEPRLYLEPSNHPVCREPVDVTLIPYFRWGNREPGAMRVWLPELVS